MNKKKRWMIAAVISIFAFFSIFRIMGNKRRMPPDANIVNSFYGSIHTSISTTGVIKPQNRLEIKPPIKGRIDKIKVKEGDRVKHGQVLALMSSTERAALLDAALLEDTGTVKYWEGVYNATPLLAPIDGEVIVKALEPGQIVDERDVVLVLSDRLIVQAEFDETDIGKVKKGQAAIITLDAYPDFKMNGTVDHIFYESKLVRNVTIYNVDILPEKVTEEFRSGMSANVEIIQESTDNILLIPNEAIQEDEQGDFVFIDLGNQQRPEKRYIETGRADDDNTEIVSGITIEDSLVVFKEEYSIETEDDSGKIPFMPSGGQ